MTTGQVLSTGVALLVLMVITLVTTGLAGIRIHRDALIAVVRGAVQLSAIAVVIAWIFQHPGGIAIYLPVMITVASFTAARRIGLGRMVIPQVAMAISAGAMATVLPVLASGALASDAGTVLPFTAQVIGGAMSAAAVSGGRMREDARTEWGTVEAWIALGARPGQAVAEQARRSVRWALVPSIDQTRSAGLVTLPGAFVGLLLGGASPARAAQVQILVLAGLLAAQAVSGTLTVRMLAGRVGAQQPAAT